MLIVVSAVRSEGDVNNCEMKWNVLHFAVVALVAMSVDVAGSVLTYDDADDFDEDGKGSIWVMLVYCYYDYFTMFLCK